MIEIITALRPLVLVNNDPFFVLYINNYNLNNMCCVKRINRIFVSFNETRNCGFIIKNYKGMKSFKGVYKIGEQNMERNIFYTLLQN